jgi:hypothetical protein
MDARPHRTVGARTYCAHARLSLFAFALLAGCDRAHERWRGPAASGASSQERAVVVVESGGDLQAAIEAAAAGGAAGKVVRVRGGTYRPKQAGQALIWFNARHDGLTVEADGPVVLTAENPEIADRRDPSFPAVVNHVVYFGDGVGPKTVLRGFTITGANHFVTRSETPGPVQPELPLAKLAKALFFYSDGGGIKVFGRSFPTLERLVVRDNYASPCAGGLSIEHRGFALGAVTVRDCVFANNRCEGTGAAADVLPGSAANFENCLFVGNVANLSVDPVSPEDPYNAEHGSGALTVFEHSRVRVERCTFTDNWNGVDDKGADNVYADCLFWRNVRRGGISRGSRYELDILDADHVSNCRVGGGVADLRRTINPVRNLLGSADPDFDASFEPHARGFEGVGYRAFRAAQ